MTNKLIIKDPFEMPAVDDTAVLVLRECADLVPHCWIWNESVGYLEVVAYSGYDIYVTVKNVGMKENATSGTIFPSCMEFLITAPNATPIIDNTVTCLRADFNCPTVGQEALMSVDSTSAIRTGDLIIVDTRYQYLVTEIINEHTMKVLNEEKGKEGGVINVNCNECVPVKIFESTHCCETLQEQVDDIYNRLDTKKSITPATDSLISVSNGSQVLTDAFNDVVLDVDTDLSKYDNATSRFITLSDIPQIPTVNDATLTIYNSDGVTPFIEFSANAASNVTATLPQSGNTYTADSPLNIADNKITISQASATTDGYLSSTDWNTFNNKSGGLSYFEEYKDSNNVAMFQPISGTANTFDLGSPTNYYESGYINDIFSSNTHTTFLYINDVTHSDVASIRTHSVEFDFSSIVGLDNLVGSTHTISTPNVTISNSYSHTIQCLIDVSMFISRLRVSQTGNKLIDVSLLGQLNVTNTTTNTTNTIDMCNWYAGQPLDSSVSGNSWKEYCPMIIYTEIITLDANTTYDINASGILSFPGGDSSTICNLPGGVIQRGYMRLTLIIQ